MDEYTESFVVAPASSLRFFYVLLTLGALWVILVAPLASVGYKLLLLVCACLLLVCSCCSRSLDIHVIEYHSHLGWVLLMDDSACSAELRNQSVVTRFISILYFTGQDKKNYYTICLGGFLATFYYRSLRRLLLL